MAEGIFRGEGQDHRET